MKREKVDANPSKNKSQRDKLPNSKMAAGSKASDDLDIDRLAKYSTVTKKIFTQQTKELMQQVGNSSSISSGKNGSMIEKKQKGMMKYKKGNNNIVDSKATKLHQNVERMMQYSSTNDFLQPNKEFKFESNQMLNSITEAVKNLRTINDYYKFIVDCLEFNKDKLTYGQSSLNAHDDAALLLLHSLKKPILLQGTKEDNQTDISVEQHKYQRVKQDEGVTILTRLRRRVTNKMPVAYLVGCSYLQGQLFQVAPNTIIPRSYLAEILRELGANHSDPENIAVINMMKVHRVLDLCCGGGSLAILAAKFLPKIDHVDAVDIDDDALATAKENILKHNMGTKIHSYKSDLYEGLGPARKYDLIISNPPYVEKQVVPLVPKEFQAEPIRAFDGGKHGMEIIKRILVDAEKYLHDSGYLLMEIGLTRKHFPRYFSKEFLHRILWIDTVRSRGEVFLVKKEDLRVSALKR
jgi:ribosomal protein L3 glutamine methyltransferase